MPPAHEVVEPVGIQALRGRAPRDPQVRLPLRRVKPFTCCRGPHAEVAGCGALDLQQLGRRVMVRDAHRLVTPATDHAVALERPRHLGHRDGAAMDCVGGRAHRDEGRGDLEDVRPAAQQVRERGPQPADRVLADVERRERHLAAGRGVLHAAGRRRVIRRGASSCVDKLGQIPEFAPTPGRKRAGGEATIAFSPCRFRVRTLNEVMSSRRRDRHHHRLVPRAGGPRRGVVEAAMAGPRDLVRQRRPGLGVQPGRGRGPARP